MKTIVKPLNKFNGTFTVPGDKSISHRAVMFGAIARGETEITNFLNGEDCLSTIDCFKKLGVNISVTNDKVVVHGVGLHGLKAPTETLDVGNSGTTMRLITGLLSAQNFTSEITGDSSIQKRPMDRVFIPLREMGANLHGLHSEKYAPFRIVGSKLEAIDYTLPVASAQVKSAILLASLYAKGTTIVREPLPTRDHTEIMLNHFGANISNENGIIKSSPVSELHAKPICVPSDISSAAFLIVAALITPNSNITITNVGLNKTRTGIIEALIQMGASITVLNQKTECGELIGDICVKSSQLKAIHLKGEIVPRMIDEIPIFAVAASMANGETIISDASELKVKESNRIKSVVTELTKMGVNIIETEDGMKILGGNTLKGAHISNYNDHRLTMAMAIAALVADGETEIDGAETANISFPGFFQLFH